MRIEVTKWERWPYSTSSLVPLIIGVPVDVVPGIGMFGILSCRGVPKGDVWADAGVWPSAAKPLATAPDIKSSLRLVGFEPAQRGKIFRGMGDFLLSQPIHGGPTADEIIRAERDSRP